MSGGKSETDPMWVLALAAGLAVGAAWLLWHFFRVQCLEAMRWVRLAELAPIALFDRDFSPCITWLMKSHANDLQPSAEVMQATNSCFGVNYLRTVPTADLPYYYQLSGISIGVIETGITYYYHWPLALVFAGFAYYIYFVSPRNKFRTRYDLESFIKMQAKMWPVIAPIVEFNPMKTSARNLGGKIPDKLPMFAEALSPEEWVSWNRISVTNNIPDREATRRAFVQQLGPRWDGVEGTPMHVQALFAAFALKGVQRREESDELLSEVAVCWTPKKGLQLPSSLISKINKINNDPEVGGQAATIAEAHAYRAPALCAVLKWARLQGGVLAPAQFLWLRGLDRALWYPLNNFGRRSFHSEGAGALAHFMAEQNAKKPLPIPRVDTAIITLNQYLATTGRPIPPRENPSSDGKAKKKK